MRNLVVVGMLALAACMPAPEQPKVSIELGFGHAEGGIVITGGAVVERTGVSCKTGSDNVGKSCTNTSHSCSDLADDMVSCCGSKENVKTASCNDKTGGEGSGGDKK